MNRKIGLTGGIASGKSEVAARLADMLHCPRLDADEICRRLLEPQADGWREFTRAFGTGYLRENGAIDRPLLRRDLFSDAKFRHRVNNVIHPLVRKTIMAEMDDIIASGPDARVLVEVPLLYEVGWEGMFDTVVVVYADYETCLKRLMARDSITRAEAVRTLESQMDLSEKAMRADHVVNNSGGLPETDNQLQHLAQLLAGN